MAELVGVRAIWRRRLGVLSVTFFGRSRLHLAEPVAMFHLPLPTPSPTRREAPE